jgi:hypothetical protein
MSLERALEFLRKRVLSEGGRRKSKTAARQRAAAGVE